MSDLYHIPNDDGKSFRLRKFVEYQHAVPPIDNRVLGEWINRHDLGYADTVFIAGLESATYNELTAALLYTMLQRTSPEDIWMKHKTRLFINSARQWVKRSDKLPDIIRSWQKELGKIIFALHRDEAPVTKYNNIHKMAQKIVFTGRFGADLFCEQIAYTKDRLNINISEPPTLDWRSSSNLTSGIYNIFYEDEKAAKYEKTHTVTKKEAEWLTGKLKDIQREIAQTYPEQLIDINTFIGKICSFRNLFKGRRYAGYHHDRELGQLRAYEQTLPQYSDLWREFYDIRKTLFEHRFLGELNGWDGIRKERCKLWLNEGRTGAEL